MFCNYLHRLVRAVKVAGSSNVSALQGEASLYDPRGREIAQEISN